MKLSVMQPYFFPYMGYFQLLNHSDHLVVFDVVQYNKKSWMNRNRLIHPSDVNGFQYTSVPVQKHSKGTLIQDIQIDQESNWQTRLMGQLTVYKKLNAPNYLVIKELVEEIIFQKHVTLNQLLVKCLAETCKYIGINLEYEFASNLKLEKSAIKQPGDWALEISKFKEAQEYINLPSGYEIFDEKRFLNSGVRLKFIKSHLSPYPQSRREEFNAGLSIIDVLMFNNLSHVKNILETDYAIHNQKSLKSEL